MKTLSKLKLHALKNENESVLSKDQMKGIRGGAYIYCANSGYEIRGIVDSCSESVIQNICGFNGGRCSNY